MKKIFIIFIIFILCITIKSYSKYNFNYNLECFEILIEKDEEPPKYEINYSCRKWTNQDVTIKVKFSEEIEGLEGFKNLNGYYVKTISNNESNEIKVKDLAGNETLAVYNVDWIDKIPPIIEGIENNAIYYQNVIANYKDNQSGIKEIKKEFYGDLLVGLTKIENNIKISVLRHPKNIKEYKYYRTEFGKENYIKSNQENIIFNNIDFNNISYYVEALDNLGNSYKSNIVIENETVIDNSYFNYTEKNNEFSKSGYYDIKIIDNAGNEVLYTIEIKK